MGHKRQFLEAFGAHNYHRRLPPAEQTPPSSPPASDAGTEHPPPPANRPLLPPADVASPSPTPPSPPRRRSPSPTLASSWAYRSVAFTPARGAFRGFHYEEDFGKQVRMQYSLNCARDEMRRQKYGAGVADAHHAGFTPPEVRERWQAKQEAAVKAFEEESDTEDEDGDGDICALSGLGDIPRTDCVLGEEKSMVEQEFVDEKALSPEHEHEHEYTHDQSTATELTLVDSHAWSERQEAVDKHELEGEQAALDEKLSLDRRKQTGSKCLWMSSRGWKSISPWRKSVSV